MLRTVRVLAAAVVALSLGAGAATAQTGGTIAIGYTGPLSGGAAAYGQDVQRGIQMAIDEVNAEGGVTVGGKKQQLRLVSLDDQYRPNEAQNNAKRLAQQEHAPIVFCPHSGGILAIEDFNAKDDPKFVLAAYTSDPAILKKNDTMMVMLPPSFDEYFKPYAQTEMKRFGKKLGLLTTTTAYGNAWVKGFSDAWKAAGGTVLSNNGVDYNTTTDFSTAVSKALSEKPDVLLIGGPSQPTGLVIKAARDQGFNGGFAILDQAKFDQIQQVIPLSRLEGSIGVLPFTENTGPGIKPFLDAYSKKYGNTRPAVSEEGVNYLAMHVFANAITMANSTDPAAIMAKMHQAAQSLPGKYQPLAIHGISKSGHLLIDAFAAVVDRSKYSTVALAFTE